MLGNACDRRRWRIKGARVGVAVEIARRSKPQSNFGHRKRGCEATSSPSALATPKALKQRGFKAFICLSKSGTRSVTPHSDDQFERPFRIYCHLFPTIPSATSSI